jgi:Lysine-specific metallo-endopeptidase
MKQSTSWTALTIVAAAALLLVTDVQVMSYAQGPAVPAVPTYRDCTPGITLDPNANLKLENARQRAIKFIDAARTVLSNAPAPGSLYETALNRHFVAPTAADRATISDHYKEIRDTLRVGNYICNTPVICENGEYANWGGLSVWNDDLIHVCRAFFNPNVDITCRAIILIHEGAHDEGIDADTTTTDHTPYRGDPAYPTANRAPPANVTTAERMNNPDAYGFFAAHIWRNTDTGRPC